jgi:VanZ family protein
MFMAAALYPFQFRAIQVNNAECGPSAEFRFDGPGMLRTARSPAWLARAIGEKRIQIALRARSLSPHQGDFSRIFTISRNPDERNLSICQNGSDLAVRIRTSEESSNGLPAVVVRGVFRDSAWHQIQVSIEPGSVAISVDGAVVLTKDMRDCPFAFWDAAFPVAFGNEITGDRPWIGQIRDATVAIGEFQMRISGSPGLRRPPLYIAGEVPDFFPPPQSVFDNRNRLRDAILNYVCFIPLGYFLDVFNRRRSPLTPVGVCAALSLTVELLQIVISTRFPSASDLLLNTLGAATGVWCGRWLALAPTGARKD